MSENLKNISESIDAVRDRIQKIEDMATKGTAHPEVHFAGAAECLDILLAQIAEEIGRAWRGVGSAQALGKLIKEKLR